MTPRPTRRARSLRATALVAVALLAGACESRNPTPPSGLRYGQVGSVRLEVTTPIGQRGTLSQSIDWGSNGVWSLREALSYDGRLGDANDRPSAMNPEVAAGLYSQWITLVNDVQGAQLFVPELDANLVPTCGPDQAILRLTIQDDARRSSESWTRCGVGPLENIGPAGAGPDPAASRVFQAGQQLRNFTILSESPAFQSVYRGTQPFATIDRGEVSDAPLTAPIVIRDPADWQEFWAAHDGGTLPPVDFELDVVIVAAVGQRTEAGSTVEVRRVLPVTEGTFIEAVEQVPGDFCSPAGLRRTPFHIIVTPRVPEPIRFSEVKVERIPCG